MPKILGIDPGNKESAYVVVDLDTYKPVCFGKHLNIEIREIISKLAMEKQITSAAIETMVSYGKGVGSEVFDTCIWIGRFAETLEKFIPVKLISRREIKKHLCSKDDASVKASLVKRFASSNRNYGKGTAKHPDFFFGFKSDIWSAMALSVCYIDKGVIA